MLRKNDIVIRTEKHKEFNIKKESTIISYATRGMEPLRFSRIHAGTAKAIHGKAELKVIIAGVDRCAYSYKAPTHNGS